MIVIRCGAVSRPVDWEATAWVPKAVSHSDSRTVYRILELHQQPFTFQNLLKQSY